MKKVTNIFGIVLFLVIEFGVSYSYGRSEESFLYGPGTTIRVSINSSGEQTNDRSGSPSISADGRFVAFSSYASNLISGDTNEESDIFIHDIQMGTTNRVSVSSSNEQANNVSGSPSISADGRFVAFSSYASNLVDGDTNFGGDVFVHDLQTAITTRVSISSTGKQGERSLNQYPSISADGRYVAFKSEARNLVESDTNKADDIFVHDRQTGITRRVSVNSSGEEANNDSKRPSISADGRFVAFSSYASNLVDGDTNGQDDIFVHDLQTGITTCVSVNLSGERGKWWSRGPSISADGRYVALTSYNNLTEDDVCGWWDIFVRARETGTTSLVSISCESCFQYYGCGPSAWPCISADGRYISFHSKAFNLVQDDTNGVYDIFVHDRQTGITRRVSVNSSGEEGNEDSHFLSSISADGRYVAFQSEATNLVEGDTNGFEDVFVHVIWVGEQPINQPPDSPESLAQLRSDGTEIAEGAATTETTVTFKGTISDPDGDQVRLEIELRKIDESFTGEPTPETISEFVPSGTEVTITRYGLIDADYHWQARTVDEHGETSSWLEFSENDISEIDFTVRSSNLFVTSPLVITSLSHGFSYFEGDTLSARFTITNKSREPIALDILVAGGRDPNGEVIDFTPINNITIYPSDNYDYQGEIVLPKRTGFYTFFCTYYTSEDGWDTTIDVELDGILFEDAAEKDNFRMKHIEVLPNELKRILGPAKPPATWEFIDGPWIEPDSTLSKIVVNPNDPQIVFAVVSYYHYYWGYQGDELYKSIDSGLTWQQIGEGLPRLRWPSSRHLRSIGAIVIAPSESNTLYAGISNSGQPIYKSIDGGLTWISTNGPSKKIYLGLSRRYPGVQSIVVDQQNPDVIYVGTERYGVWKTTDAGENWYEWGVPFSGLFLVNYVDVLAMVSTEPIAVYASGYNVLPSTNTYWPLGIYKRVDSPGEDWYKKDPFLINEAVPSPLSQFVKDIKVVPNGQIVYFATNNNKVYRSPDAGSTWKEVSGSNGVNPLPESGNSVFMSSSLPCSLVVDSRFPNVIYAGSAAGGISFSYNSGEDWFPIGLQDIGVKQIMSDGNTSVLYAVGTLGKSLYKLDISSRSATVVRKHSPGELRVYDSQGNVTGLVNGEIIEDIPNSGYNSWSDTVIVYSASEPLWFEVIGTEEGTYGLDIISVKDGNAVTFEAIDIPTSPNSVHQYNIDWGVLAQEENGVILQIDADGDGDFEEIIIAGNRLVYLPAKIEIQKMIIKAGKIRGDFATDSFVISGRINSEDIGIILDPNNDLKDISISVVHEVDSTVYGHIETLDKDKVKIDKRRRKLSYKNRFKKGEDGGVTSLKVNLSRGTFKITAKNVNLFGLRSPIIVGIEIGNYFGKDEVDETIINGPKKPIPMQLLMGYANSLRVDKHKFKLGKKKPSTDYLMVQGAIAIQDTLIDLADENIIIRWGTFKATLDSDNLFQIGAKKVFKYKKPKGQDASIAAAIFDLEKCKFKLLVKKAVISEQEYPVIFGIEFSIFNETYQVSK